MAMPPTKALLLDAATREREALSAKLAGLAREQLLWRGVYGWSAKDHVAHLAEWERMLVSWCDAGWRGESPAVPGEGYTWATLSDLNQRIFDEHRDDRLEHVMADWHDTSGRLIALTEATSEADLFAPGRFTWTGRGTLASFVYECGPNHHRWSAAEIREGLKVRP
jgi:hypothetical protein